MYVPWPFVIFSFLLSLHGSQSLWLLYTGLLNSRVRAEALPLQHCLLQFLRLLPSHREGKRRRNCKKFFAVAAGDYSQRPAHTQLNATVEKPDSVGCSTQSRYYSIIH